MLLLSSQIKGHTAKMLTLLEPDSKHIKESTHVESGSVIHMPHYKPGQKHEILCLLLIMLLLLFISVKIINRESLHKHHWPTEGDVFTL